MMCRSKTHLSKEALSAIEKQRNVEAVMADNVLLRSILRRREAVLSSVAMDARAEGSRDVAAESLLLDIALLGSRVDGR